jgi:hypothetical protein
MAEIVNLRMARKARARTAAEQKAAENRAKFGRTKAEKAAEQAEVDRKARALDGARRDSEDETPI